MSFSSSSLFNWGEKCNCTDWRTFTHISTFSSDYILHGSIPPLALQSLTVTLWPVPSFLFLPLFTSLPFTPILQPWLRCPPSSSPITMAMPYKLIFNTALLFPNQIHPFLPYPSLWQWWIVAFTHLSLLHISLPIRLTTQIHTCRLFILLSFHRPQTPALCFLHFPLILSLSHYCVSFSSNHAPSLLHLVRPSLVFLFFLPLTAFRALSLLAPLVLGFLFSISKFVPALPLLSIHPEWLKKAEYDRNDRSDSIKRMSGLTVHTTAARRGHVGVLLFLAQRERGRWCVYESASL